MKLSRRLAAIAGMIPERSSVADIGTDHAYLPIYLAKRGTYNTIIATEVSAGPLARALSNVSEHKMENRVELRLGSGLEVLSKNEVDVIIMAGMGGTTITELLDENRGFLSSLRFLVLQPMGDTAHLRRWLDQNGFFPADEDLVYEEEKYYEIMAVKKGLDQRYREFRHLVGPCLIEKRHPLLVGFLKEKIRKRRDVLSQLKRASSAKVKTKEKAMKEETALYEEVLSWLSESKT